MSRKQLITYRTATFDCETDPFRANRMPVPFTCGLLCDDGEYFATWGDNCVADMMELISRLAEDYVIFVHAGGRFDFQFLWDWIEEPVTIAGGKLIEFSQGVRNGKAQHVWRDSYAAIPVPLSEFHKEAIDYRIFEAHRRHAPRNRARIEQYLRSDCDNLMALVQAFRVRFEDKKLRLPLTIGSLALRELKHFHSWERATDVTDDLMRPHYFGGRTQCFAHGIVEGPWRVYDANSHYAKAMRDFDHPLTDDWEELDEPPLRSKGVWFAEVLARNRNALPWRDPTAPDNAVDFDMAEAVFEVCSHELLPAIASGMVEVLEWRRIERPVRRGNFRAFVDAWYPEKAAARRRGDAAGAIFAKSILNAASGKFGQDPRKYKQYAILRDQYRDGALVKGGYHPEVRVRAEPPEEYLELWSRASFYARESFQNVGIAASITSASRSLMMAALMKADTPIYCDTDSMICRAFRGRKRQNELGAWKLEATAEFAAIAGRKKYCLYNKRGSVIEPVKWAPDHLEPKEIIEIAKGGTVDKVNEAPIWSLAGVAPFYKRTYEKTVADAVKPFRV